MASVTIAEQLIKIAVKGLDAAQAQFGKLQTAVAVAQKHVQKMSDSLEKLGSRARTQFAIGTASVLGFVRAASPGDFLRFEAAIARVSVQIGAMFLPVIRSFTSWLNKLADALNSLTPAQREQIGLWTKYGLVLLGVVGFTSKLVSLMPGLLAGLQSVIGAFATLGGGTLAALAPYVVVVGGIVAGLAAVAAVGVIVAGKTDQIVGSLGKIWDRIKAIGKAIWDAVKPVAAVLGDAIAKAFEGLARTFDVLGAKFQAVWKTVGAAIQRSLPVIQQVFGTLLGFVNRIVATVGGVMASTFSNVVPKLVGMWQAVAGVVAKILPLLTSIGGTILGVFGSIGETVGSIMGRVFAKVAAIIPKLTPIFTAWFSVVQQVWKGVAAVVEAVMPLVEDLADMFLSLTEAAQPFVDGVLKEIVTGFQEMLPVVRTVVNYLVNGLRQAVTEIRALGYVLAELRKNPNLIFTPNKLASQAAAEMRRIDDLRKRAAKDQADARNEQNQKPGKVTQNGVELVLKPELGGIGEAMRRAQTAALGESPQLAAAREQIKLLQQGNDAQRATKESVDRLNVGLR